MRTAGSFHRQTAEWGTQMKRIVTTLFAVLIVWISAQPGLAAQSTAAKETLLHVFGHGTDGIYPSGGLVNANGTLYGATEEGGAYGSGTVFSFDLKSGTETVIYSFCSRQGCTDGASPVGLTSANGALYGTTFAGGSDSCAGGCGTVFTIDPNSGTETVLHSFLCSKRACRKGLAKKGQSPYAGPIYEDGILFGTTGYGGTGIEQQGTVFSVDPNTGAEKLLHSFCSQRNCADGQYPVAGLIDAGGTLYGTTEGGGTGLDDCEDFYSCGVVFSLDPATRAQKVLYSFCSGQNCADGASPVASLNKINNTLYGTTYGGGSVSLGTVFAIDLNSGKETVLYSFCTEQGCADGMMPDAGVTDVNGMLYGTTKDGGAHGAGGTVFALDPATGTETVLYSFCSQTRKKKCTDGAEPGALIDVGGTLYGTTFSGGAGCFRGKQRGCGTLFALKP
jgi:uncharacterized repeat protein (TIGR03803 family)